MSQAVVETVFPLQETNRVPTSSAPVAMTPMEMLGQAVSNGASVEVLSKLMDLQERWNAAQARKAFDEAIAAAKSKIPVISKNKQVGFESRKAGAARTDYKHETLDEIARVVTPILAEHGLSYRFRATSNINEPVTVTCIISHRDGHSEENTLCAGRDETGNKNSIQAIGSTVTYLQRYTLKAALGLAAAADDDGGRADETSDVITAEQRDELQELIDETKSDIRRFCAAFGVNAVADLTVAAFPRAHQMLTAKRAQK